MRTDEGKFQQGTGLLFLLLVACTEQKPIALPQIKINNNPVEVYEITLRMDDMATPPKAVSGKVSYMVDNREKCLPVDQTRAIGGVRPELYREQLLKYERVSDYVFRTHVYEDAILNENYYGLGVCDWGAQSVSVYIQTASTTQIAGVTNKNIKSETPHVVFCPNKSHGQATPDQSCISQARFEQQNAETRKRFYKVEILSRRMPSVSTMVAKHEHELGEAYDRG